MATVHKTSDPSIPGLYRSASFSSASSDFAQGDVIDIQKSLGRTSERVEIACAADAAVTIRINAQHTRYPLYSHAKAIGYWAPDLTAGQTYINSDAPTLTVAAGETVLIDDTAISNLEVTSLTAGAGAGVVITAR